MKQVNCGSYEYRWRTRQYLQNEECENVLSKRFFFFFMAKRKQNEKNGMNYLKRDEKKKITKKQKNSRVRAAR